MKIKNTNKGITLIALVITIIVMLILVAVTITMAVNGGLFDYAGKAVGETQNAIALEQQLADGKIQVDGKWYASINDYIKGKELMTLPSDSTTSPFLPANSEVTNNSFETGVTIKDSKGNEYVWIVVPKTEEVYSTAGLSITDFAAEEYTSIYNDLKTYTTDYSSTGYEDVWYDGCGIESEDKYNELKNIMLKSVYQNGGFYIGKYETGTDTIRTSTSQTLTEAKIQSELFPYTYVTVAQAQEMASGFATGSNTSSLMFGVQWDLVCKYIEKSKINHVLTSDDAVSMGNYYSSSFEITKGMYSEDNGQTYQQVENSYNKVTSKSVLLQTGLTVKNSILNIYDLGGNVWEFTLEKSNTNDTSYYATARGGRHSCVNPGNTDPVKYQSRSYAELGYSGYSTWGVSDTSFRVSLY